MIYTIIAMHEWGNNQRERLFVGSINEDSPESAQKQAIKVVRDETKIQDYIRPEPEWNNPRPNEFNCVYRKIIDNEMHFYAIYIMGVNR